MNELSYIIQTASTWHEIHESLCKNAKAGLLFEEFCKLFYLTEPSVKNDYKNVWKFHELPTHVKEKLGLGRTDHGVDIVLEGVDGSLSVVQCKFKNDQSSKISWTKDRLSNLFAEGNKADYLIVFTNASGIDKHSKSKERLTIITAGDLVNLSSTTIEQIKLMAKGEPIKPVEPKKPRGYQNEAIANVIQGFSQNDRGQLILPCGAGKTLVSLWIKNSLKAKHTLVLVPSLALLKQIKDEWTANSSYAPRICVCSEKDIDKGSDSTVSNIYEIGGQVSTNSWEIRAFLNKHEQSIVYSTYQSLEKISDAIKGTVFQFDLAICDEAHKTSGNKQNRYALIHSNLHVPIKKRLYMTATPRVLSSSLKTSLTDEIADYIQDMSNPAIFGPEFHRMSFKEAIDNKILVDYQIVAIGVSNHEVQHAISQRTYVSENETIDEVANNYALDKFMRKHGSTHVLTFHSSVKRAKSFMARHKAMYNEITTFHVNGEQSTNERKVSISEFVRSPRSVITNARCLTEGVDVPAIDAVYFCDPKNSKVDIVQATGRALRRADYKGKEFGYVIVPIYHHVDQDVEDIIDKGPFKNLLSIIRALSSHDERLMDEIKKIKIIKGEAAQISEHNSIYEQLELIKLEGFGATLDKYLISQIICKTPVPYREFENARKFVQTLGLKGRTDWEQYFLSDSKPLDIPLTADRFYKNKGWISWGDWFGTNIIAPMYRTYRPFEEAKAFVHSLDINSVTAWGKYCKSGNKPDDIPAAPHHVYKNVGWVSWSDWVGNGKVKSFRDFHEARAFVHCLELKNTDEWKKYSKCGKKPTDIPAAPQNAYKHNGWISMGDWLGTKFVANQNRAHRLYNKAVEFVHNLALKNRNDWRTYLKSGEKPDDIPADPANAYKDNGWVGFGDWLGTGKVANQSRKFLPFHVARKFVNTLKLKNLTEWKLYCKSDKKPNNIPADPKKTYNTQEWISWNDWLGTGKIANQNRQYRSFEEARKYVHNLALKNVAEWKIYCKSEDKPDDIPVSANQVYKDSGWISFGDWLGTGTIANQKKK